MAFDRVSAKNAGYTDQEIDSYLSSQNQNAGNATPGLTNTPTIAPQSTPSGPPSVGGFIQNAGQDVNDILKGILGLPKTAIGLALNPSQIPQAGQNLVQGLFNEAKRVLPVSMVKPIPGSDITLPGLNPGKTLKAFYDKPFSTALDAYTLADIGGIGKGAQAVTETAPKENLLTKAGEAIRPKSPQIQLKGSLYGAEDEAFANATLKKYTTPGASPEQMYQQIGPAAKSLYDNVINPELENNPQQISMATLKQKFADQIEQQKWLGLTGKKAQNAIDGFLGQYFGKAPEGPITEGAKAVALPSVIDSPTVFNAKTNLNQGMGLILRKIANGSDLTDIQKVTLAGRNALDSLITEVHPNIKQATKEYGALTEAAKPLAALRTPRGGAMDPLALLMGAGGAAAGGGIAGIGAYGATRLLESPGGKNLLANILQGAGKSVGVAPNLIPGLGVNPVTGAYLGNILSSSIGQPSAPGINQLPDGIAGNQPNNNISQSMSPSSGQTISQGNTNVNQVITPEQVSLAYRTLPPIMAERVKNAYDAQQLALGPQTIASLIGTTRQLVDKATGVGPIGSRTQQLARFLGTGVDPTTTQLNANLNTLRGMVAMEFVKRGISSPEAMKQLNDILPTTQTSKEDLTQKLDALPEALGQIFKSYGVTIPGGQ